MIGPSDGASIGGEGKGKTVSKLLEKELGGNKIRPRNRGIVRGKRYEGKGWVGGSGLFSLEATA